jgi:hypothetical protein
MWLSRYNPGAIRAQYSLLNPWWTIQHEPFAADDMDKVQVPKLVPESLSEELDGE